MEKNIGNKENNLRISGSGSAGGGIYNEVKISGSGTINGDIECKEFATSGSSKVVGNVKARSVRISGSGRIDGDMECEEVKISGSAKISGSIKGTELRVSGSANFRGNISCEEVKISGSVQTEGDCEAEKFRASGSFKIGGLLNAGEIEIKLGGKCKVKEIGGETIEVKKENSGIIGSFIKSLFNSNDQLITDVIEGDKIYLEYTIAETVRGNNVVIGPGCEIQNIEYKEKIEVNSDSKVGNSTKM